MPEQSREVPDAIVRAAWRVLPDGVTFGEARDALQAALPALTAEYEARLQTIRKQVEEAVEKTIASLPRSKPGDYQAGFDAGACEATKALYAAFDHVIDSTQPVPEQRDSAKALRDKADFVQGGLSPDEALDLYKCRQAEQRDCGGVGEALRELREAEHVRRLAPSEGDFLRYGSDSYVQHVQSALTALTQQPQVVEAGECEEPTPVPADEVCGILAGYRTPEEETSEKLYQALTPHMPDHVLCAAPDEAFGGTGENQPRLGSVKEARQLELEVVRQALQPLFDVIDSDDGEVPPFQPISDEAQRAFAWLRSRAAALTQPVDDQPPYKGSGQPHHPSCVCEECKEGEDPVEEKAVDVLRRFMCCKAGEQFVDEKLLRPFGFTLDPGPVVRSNRNLVDALEWIEVETRETHTRDAARRAVEANRTQPSEVQGNSGGTVTLGSGEPVEVCCDEAKQAVIERDHFAVLAGWNFEGDGEHRIPWDFERVKSEVVALQHEDTQSGNSGGERLALKVVVSGAAGGASTQPQGNSGGVEELRDRFVAELEKARQGHVRPGSIKGDLFDKDHAKVALADVNAALDAVFTQPSSPPTPEGSPDLLRAAEILVLSHYDADCLPDDLYADELARDGFLRCGSDHTGEGFTHITHKGSDFVRETLEAARLEPSTREVDRG